MEVHILLLKNYIYMAPLFPSFKYNQFYYLCHWHAFSCPDSFYFVSIFQSFVTSLKYVYLSLIFCVVFSWNFFFWTDFFLLLSPISKRKEKKSKSLFCFGFDSINWSSFSSLLELHKLLWYCLCHNHHYTLIFSSTWFSSP